MSETAIVKAGQQNIIRTMDDAERAARAMSASGFFTDAKQASQAVVKILAGQELGFGPFASMTGVAIIQGKPAIGANLMAAALKRTGKYNYRVTKNTDKEVEIAFFEGGQEIGKSSFTWEDAVKAQLSTKDIWKKYPRNMLFARALSNGIRWYTPDIYNGATVYTPEEMGATVDEEGNVIEVKAEDPAGNPDPIDDKAWDIYTALCAEAEKFGIEYTIPDREKTTKADLRREYADLERFVKDAKAQAEAA